MASHWLGPLAMGGKNSSVDPSAIADGELQSSTGTTPVAGTWGPEANDSVIHAATFIGMAVGPLLLCGILVGWRSYHTQLEQALVHQREINRNALFRSRTFIAGATEDLRLLDLFHDLENLDPAEFSSWDFW